jgi:peptide/nickel transport system permease protein
MSTRPASYPSIAEALAAPRVALAPPEASRVLGPLALAWRRIGGWRIDLVLALTVLAVLALCALVPGALAPYAPTDLDHAAVLAAPSLRHWAGTDNLGRDMAGLIVFGARETLFVALASAVIGTLGGVLVGLASGYGGRRADAAITRLTEVWLAIPDVLLVIVIATVLTPGIGSIALTIGVVLVPRTARVVRGQVIALRHRPHVVAARALGASERAILIDHVLPHMLSPLLVMTTLSVAGAALMGAMISFLGLGGIEDAPDWGYQVSQARAYLTVAWWMGVYPGLAITVFVITVNLLGDRLRARFDPRGR